METNFQRGLNISYPDTATHHPHARYPSFTLAYPFGLKKPIFGALVFWKDMFAKAVKIGIPLGTNSPLDFGILGSQKI